MQRTNSKDGVWYYNPTKTRSKRKKRYSRHKQLLYHFLYRGVSSHDLFKCFWLLDLLPRCNTIDCYAVYRYIMIMINTLKTESISKNFIIYLESLLSKLSISKPDMFVEFVSYFVKNNRIDDARELYSQRVKYMSYQIHRKIPFMDVNIQCYGLLLNYLDWKSRIASEKAMDFDVSIQGWLVNGMEPLRSVEHNYEIFLMCIVNVLLYYGFWKKAYLFVSEFQRNNSENLAAQLLLYKLIDTFNPRDRPKRRRMLANYLELTSNEEEGAREQNRMNELASINNFSVQERQVIVKSEEFPIITDKKNILFGLRRIDPTRDELLDLSNTYLNKVEAIKLIMDSLEHVSKIRDAARWRCLQESLDEIRSSKDAALIEGVSNLWRERYKQFWRIEHFTLLAADNNKNRQLIKGVIRTLNSRFDLPDR